MRQYQRGVHTPRFSIAQNLANALDVLVEYFYSTDDQTTGLLPRWYAPSKAEQGQLLKSLKESS